MLGMNLIELGPDQMIVVKVETTGERDLGTGREHHLGFRATFCGQEITAIDHGRRQMAMTDP